MIDYLYDGTFEGLLTTIFYTFTERDIFNIYKKDEYIENLFDNKKYIKTEEDKFQRVYDSIVKKLSLKTLKNIYYIYLSEEKENEILIYKYLKLCYKFGNEINLAKNNDIIINVDKCYKRVSFEGHRFKGLVRFKEIGALSFYSEIEPDNNILPVVITHFTERYSDQNFIIADIKRNIAIIYNKDQGIITDFYKEDREKILKIMPKDKFEDLFKTFYNSVSIEERRNEKLRNHYLPKRYRKNLFEIE